MTQEELLMKLWEKRNSLCDNLDIHFALSAVVELHKPALNNLEYKDNDCMNCWVDYPCQTIQVIEKELN